MSNIKTKSQARERRHKRLRNKISGTSTAPRLNVFKSNTGIYAQIINDETGTTIVSSSTQVLKIKNGKNIDAAKAVGKDVAEKAVKAGITKIVFDRGGNIYHGRIKALADAAREAGLVF